VRGLLRCPPLHSPRPRANGVTIGSTPAETEGLALPPILPLSRAYIDNTLSGLALELAETVVAQWPVRLYLEESPAPARTEIHVRL
jgi:hypothetical protein